MAVLDRTRLTGRLPPFFQAKKTTSRNFRRLLKLSAQLSVFCASSRIILVLQPKSLIYKSKYPLMHCNLTVIFGLSNCAITLFRPSWLTLWRTERIVSRSGKKWEKMGLKSSLKRQNHVPWSQQSHPRRKGPYGTANAVPGSY